MGLLDRWFGGNAPRNPSGFPVDERCYAIGDVHGRDDLLDELLTLVAEDAVGFTGRKFLVYLGDYIDRGPTSRQVIERALSASLDGFETIFLKGNHEQALLDFLDYPVETAAWLTFGGRETLASYDIQAPLAPGVEDLHDLSQALARALPEDHLRFFNDGLLHWQRGDYYFVHAGVRPGVPLRKQHFEDQLWIRDEFTESRADHGAVVVHGHVISREPEFRGNRIGIDTGAFYSGVLTALVLEGVEQRTLQTRGEPG